MKKLVAFFAIASAFLIIGTASAYAPLPRDRPFELGRTPVPYSLAQTTAPAPSTTAPTTTTTATPGSGPPGTKVTTDTTISVGSIASELYNAAAALFVTTLSGSLVAFVISLLRGMNSNLAKMSADLIEKYKAQLQEVMNRGAIASAALVTKTADGKIPIDVKSKVVADMVKYAQTHAADLIKKLGEDPTSEKSISALTARAEVALADPAVPVAVSQEPAATPTSDLEKKVNDLQAQLRAISGQV